MAHNVDPSFAELVDLLDQAQDKLLTVRKHTTDPDTAGWIDGALSDALTEAEALKRLAEAEAQGAA